MERLDHIANIITFVQFSLGMHHPAHIEEDLVLGLYDLLDDAIAEEVQVVASMYERAQHVSAN